MAHLLDMSNGRANMAFVGKELPWHGLGSSLPQNAPLEIWLKEAGMLWEAKKTKQMFRDEDGTIHYGDDNILYRSDTKAQLGTCSDRYQIVQPGEVMDFYRDLVDLQGFTIETAGCLDGGKRLWALAKTDGEIAVGGTVDRMNTYLMLATSFDGSMATIGKFTSIRVVCQNTLSMSLGDGAAKIAVPHSTSFDARKMKEQLGIYEAATNQMQEQVDILAKRKMSDAEAMRFIMDVLAGKDVKAEDLSTRNGNIVKGVFDLYKGTGMGSSLPVANGTAWGALNAITENIDHHINCRDNNNRIKSAWFGKGDELKTNAFKQALALAA